MVYFNKPLLLNIGGERIIMKELKLHDSEFKLMEVIWKEEPITSTKLHKLCLERLGWKKSTTYTVLRKLSEKKILKNENSLVSSLVKKEDIQKYESKIVVDKLFDSSLPKFLTAFLGNGKISEKEAQELKRLIDDYKEE